MARFYGVIGYGESIEKRAGVYEDVIIEKSSYGDVLRNTQSQSGESPNPNISVNHSISIVADTYVNEHLSGIRYVKWAGVRWQVKSIEVQYPRLILSLGGVYNGPTPAAPSTP